MRLPSLRRIFFRDMGRKLLALALAFALWWTVRDSITVEQSLDLRVVEAPAGQEGAGGLLVVDVPEGWVLVEPAPGENVRLQLRGPRNDVEAFLPSARATYRPAVDPARQEITRQEDALDLAWARSDLAEFLLRGVPRDARTFPVRLEQLVSLTLPLRPEHLPILGLPAEEYRLLPAEVRFLEVNTVTLRGPATAMERLQRQIEASDRGSPPPAILEPLILTGTERGDLRVARRLHPELARQRITMEPPEVRVLVPIRLREPQRVEFELTQERLAALGDPVGGEWEVAPFSQRWVAELRQEPGLTLVFDEAWIRDHLIFYVNLSQITSLQQSTWQLPVEWDFWGAVDQEQWEALTRALRVHPLDPEGGTVEVRRKEQP